MKNVVGKRNHRNVGVFFSGVREKVVYDSSCFSLSSREASLRSAATSSTLSSPLASLFSSSSSFFLAFSMFYQGVKELVFVFVIEVKITDQMNAADEKQLTRWV
jgi:hypothetical protein